MPGKLSHVALRTSLLYALVAAVWILVSDKVLVALVHDPVVMGKIAVCKGWAFVAVTALLLFGVLRGQLRRWEQEAAARRLAEAYLAEAQKLTHTGSFGWNVATDEHIWSAETFHIFEYDASTKITTPLVLERAHPEDRTIVQETLERAAQERRDFQYAHRLLMPDGSVKHLHIVARCVGHEPGNVEFIGAVMDVTGQKRAEESLRRLNREVRAISSCNQTLMRATDEQTLLREICRIVCEETGYRMAWVGYAEHDEAKSVRPVAWTGTEEGYLANLGITWADTERGWSPTGTAIRSGKTCYIQDFATDPRLAPWRESVLQHSFLSGIALPLKDEHGNAFGSLSIYSAQPNAFTSEEIRLLEELAGDLAFGIVTLRSRAAREQAEQKVSLLSFAMDNVREATFLADERGRFHYVNEEACRVLGYSRAELLGMGAPDIDPEFPVERWSDHWRDLKAQRSLSFESRHRTRDGRIFPVEINANFIEYGGKTYNLALVRNITERKRADEKIRQQETEQRQVLDFTLHLVGVFGPDRKRLYVNRPALDYFGVTLEEWKGISDPFWFFHPDDRERLAKDVYTEAASDVPHEFEARLRRKDGAYRWFLFRDNPFCDEQGRITRWYLSATDIEDRKQTEQALQQSEAYLAESERLTHTGSWALDLASNKYVYVSEEDYRIWAFDPQQGLPTKEAVLQRIHPEDRNRWKGNFEKSLREKLDSLDEYRIVLPDGTIKHIRTIRHPVLNDAGDLVKLVGITIDITERKRTEEALRLSNAYNRSLIEASLDPLVTIGPDGKITDVNGATEAATGRSRGELIGTDFSDYFTEPAQARAGYEQVFREGTVRDYPLELRHRSGRVMSVLYNASVYRDESGQVIGIFAAARDITERKQAEEQAMHLATIVESSEDAVLSKTLEGVIVSWNRGAQKIYGYTAEEAVGKSISILADPGGPDETPELLRRVGQGESLDHYETVRRRKDGKLITVSLTLSPIQDASGQIIGASTIARDITERKRAAEALRLSNAYNRSLIEASLDPLVTIGSDGKITDVNGATEAATGCSRGELIGTDFCDYFTEPAQARAGYEQVFREGVVRDYPLDLRHRSGRVMSVLYNASVYRDESGRVIGVFAAARDLTERKRAEDAARRSRAYLAEAQSLSHTGSFGWNVATGEILFSDETFRHFEYDASTKVTIPLILERTHPDDIPLMQQVLARAANDGKDFDFEHRLLMPNGSVKHVHVVAHAVKDKSGNVEFIGAVMDMTAAKQAEEALQEARAELARVTRVTMMGELAASIAHEVNQPLAGVVTSANAGLNWLAKDPPNLLKTREAIERILRDGTRAGEVLTRIRTLLKRTSPTKSSVSVNQIVRDVVALTGGELRQKNIELSVELNPSLPAIMGDSIQLQQVLLNLIMNAIEAMSGITNRRKILRVQSELGELDGKPAVSLKVSDTGIGFSTTDTGRLFEAFHTTKPEGLGMGLWISRSIIEGHGGRLTAQSNDGPGATFQILLPSKTGDSNE